MILNDTLYLQKLQVLFYPTTNKNPIVKYLVQKL